MGYLIQLQRDGWYFGGFSGPTGNAQICGLERAKVYETRRAAMDDLSRMGAYGQRIIALHEILPDTKKSARESLGQAKDFFPTR